MCLTFIHSYNMSMYGLRVFLPSSVLLTDANVSKSNPCFRTLIWPKIIVMVSSGKENLSKMPNTGNFVLFYLIRVNK